MPSCRWRSNVDRRSREPGNQHGGRDLVSGESSNGSARGETNQCVSTRIGHPEPFVGGTSPMTGGTLPLLQLCSFFTSFCSSPDRTTLRPDCFFFHTSRSPWRHIGKGDCFIELSVSDVQKSKSDTVLIPGSRGRRANPHPPSSAKPISADPSQAKVAPPRSTSIAYCLCWLFTRIGFRKFELRL